MEATEVISVQTADGSEVQLSAAQLQNVSVAVEQNHHQQMLNHHQAQQQQMVNQALIQGALISAGTQNGVGTAGVVNNANTTSPPRMDFTETRRGNDLLEYVRKSRDHDKYCDVILYVHGRQFKAHRVVLSSASPYFDSIFQSREVSNSSSKLRNGGANGFNNGLSRLGKETLSVACQEPEVFSTFLNYIYTGVVSIDKNNVGELMRLSNHFLVSKLKGYCGEFLERFLDAENCLQIKDVGEKFHLPGLAKSATVFIQNNLGEVINHEIMMELPPKQIENFVSEKAWAVPQDAAVKFMSRWVCHDLGTRERDFKQLLTNIEWNNMDPNVIVDYIDQEPLYGSSERCFYYVLHSLAEKGIQVQKYEQMYQALQQRFGQEMDQPLGFGDNLLQMAFNSAMEGLQVPADSTSLLMPDGREVRIWGGKWQNENDGSGRPKLKPLSLEQRRKRILARIQRNRALKKWVVVRMDKPKRKRLAHNEIIADSSGEEECDPIQSSQGYRCHICLFVTKKVSRLERHLATVHGHDVTYRCTECGFTCKWNREYFLHMKSHYEGPPYKCHACEFNCQKIGSLIAHKVTHIDLKPYQCSECEYKCRTKANLAVHIKTHNNEKPYRCNICGRNFASKNSLDQHAIGHNTDKTYSCTQCPFSTKYLNHFTNHKKAHHTPAPSKKRELYRCQDPQCKYTTSKKSQLDSHMRSHAGVRPHVCSICGRRFLEKSHLVRHERIHFNERPFKCEECDYASTRRDKLKEHKTRHHGINASAKSPYKPRPHKNNKQPFTPGEQNLVYAKKSTVAQQTPGQTQPAQQEQTVSATVAATATGDLEFIIPHGTHLANVGQAIATSEAGGTTAYAQLSGASAIDLHHMTNGAGIVQLRPFQPGKPEIQVAHTLASIPASMSAQELQRTLGVKLEDLQAQTLIGIQQGGTARAIKLEELTGSVQVGGQTVTTRGLPAGTRVHHGTTTTMVLDAAQLQQLAQAAAAGNAGAFERAIPITIASASSSNSNNNQSSGGNSQGGNQSTEFSGLSTLLY